MSEHVHATSRAQLDSLTTKYALEGYERVPTPGDDSTVILERSPYGSRDSHVVVFVALGWWTLGLANLAFALWRAWFGEHRVMLHLDRGGCDRSDISGDWLNDADAVEDTDE